MKILKFKNHHAFLLLLAVPIVCLLACLTQTAQADEPIRFQSSAALGSTAFIYNRNEYYNPQDNNTKLAEDKKIADEENSSNDTEADKDNQVDNNVLENNDADNKQNTFEEKGQTDSSYEITGSTSNTMQIPSRYMLTTDKVTSTKVKDQGRVGTCWAFGAIAAAESSLINDGLADQHVDLSEAHFTWFEHTPITSAAQSTNPAIINSKLGEGYTVTAPNGTTAETPANNWRIANLGGFASSVYKLFATGQGPTTEAEFPYKTSSKSASLASNTGDWSIPANQRFTPAIFDLTDCNILPGTYIKKKGSSAIGIEAVKKEISQGRAVATGIHIGSTARELSQDSSYTKGGYSYMYTYNEEKSNHEVTIVGYDDSLPASQFTLKDASGVTQTPPANGAFLVKDSAGENFALQADGSARTTAQTAAGNGGGYYWVSYYDKGLYEQMTMKFQKASELKCYAYDYIGNGTNVAVEYAQEEEKEEVDDKKDDNSGERSESNSEADKETDSESDDNKNTDNSNSNKKENLTPDTFDDTINDDSEPNENNADSPLYTANIYTAQEDLKISEVSFEFLGNTDTISVEVRVLEPNEEGKFPKVTNVEPSAKTSDMRFDYGGYHRVTLDNPVCVHAGQKFAICAVNKLDNGHFAVSYTSTKSKISDANSSGYTTNGCTINCNSVVAKGESVIFYNNTITDLTSATSTLDKDHTYQNFTLNAYTSSATEEDFVAAQEEQNKNWFQTLADEFWKLFHDIFG